jgi:N-acetylmuramoyl-L-alanine amidase
MPTLYTVVAGDCLSSIAARHGFSNWRIVYDAPENADFRAKRPNPNVIYAGDVLFIPDKASKTLACSTGAKHRIQLVREPTWLRIEIKLDVPHRYLLEVGGASFTGTTSDTPIEHAIDPQARRGRIQLWPAGDDAPADAPADAITWTLDIGGLDPIDEISGVQGRLSNLGYYHGAPNGELDELTAHAIRGFQADRDLDVTGEIDQPLRDALLAAHDGS